MPKEPFQIDLSSPRVRSKGNKLTVVSMGSGVLSSIQAINQLGKKDIIELIDLRSYPHSKLILYSNL